LRKGLSRFLRAYGPFKLEVEWIKVGSAKEEVRLFKVLCEGTYQHHLQGVCTDEKAIYWSFTTTLVKTDMEGALLKKIPVANHHGDLCFHEGKLYVAVNLGEFNDAEGNADSWVYVYDAESLKELARHETQEVFHGAGGIGYRDGRFFVVGGLPDAVEENYVYEYDGKFKFLEKHVIKSGHTHLGIQTATFVHDRWWFGCYGDPKHPLDAFVPSRFHRLLRRTMSIRANPRKRDVACGRTAEHPSTGSTTGSGRGFVLSPPSTSVSATRDGPQSRQMSGSTCAGCPSVFSIRAGST